MSAERRANERRAFYAALRSDFLTFFKFAFRDLETRGPLQMAPCVELLADALQDVATGATRRLIINIPPRHLKSSLASVAFPAWLLGRDPRLRIAVVSHNRDLARDLALKAYPLVNRDWYRHLFPEMRLARDRSSIVDFQTTAGGGRYAASMDTGITGRGFDVIVVDDPLSAHDAQSAAEREKVIQSYETMIASRLDDPTRGSIIVVHQRLHEDDLTGRLLPKGGWAHIALQFVAEELKTYQLRSGVWVRRPGEVLFPTRFPPEAIESLRAQSREAIFATQYQQNPSAAGGGILKTDHVKYITLPLETPGRIVLSWDTAQKTRETSSYSVCLVIASDGRNHFVIDVLRQRLDLDEMVCAARALIALYQPAVILIEDASSGPALAQMLRPSNCVLRPTGSSGKVERFQRHLGFFADGRVFVGQDQPWTVELVNEWLRFPMVRHDDQVDAISQYLEWVGVGPPFTPFIARGDPSEALARRIFGPPPRKGEHPMRPRHRGR